MPEDLTSLREEGKSSPKTKKKQTSFQKELRSTLKDRKKRGLSAGFSDLDVTDDTEDTLEDSDDGIGSDADDLLDQFNMTMKPKRTDRPASARPRGGPLMQTMRQPWKPASTGKDDEEEYRTESHKYIKSSPTPSPRIKKEDELEKKSKLKESPKPSPRVSPKVSPKLPRKDEVKQESPAPSPRSRRLSEKAVKTSPTLTTRRMGRSPSPDEKKERSTDILDLFSDDFGAVRTTKSSGMPKPQPRHRRGPESPGRSDASSPGRRDVSPDSDKKSASDFRMKRSPEVQRKSSRDSSPTGRKSPFRTETSTKKSEKTKSFLDDSDDDETFKSKYQLSGRRSPQTQAFKSRRPQSPTMKKSSLQSDSDSDSDNKWKSKSKEKKKSIMDELITDGTAKKDKKSKKSSFFETSDDEEVSGITSKRRTRPLSPTQKDRRSPSPQQRKPSASSPVSSKDRRSPSPQSKRHSPISDRRAASPTHRKDEEKVDDLWASTPKRPPSGRKPKHSEDADEEDMGHTRRMRYISTDKDVTKEFGSARERPSTADRSRTRTRVIKPKVVTRPLSASGRLNQSMTARSDGSSTMSLTARSTTPNFDDSSSIRQAIYEDWYIQKMERAKRELQEKKRKEKEEEEKKEKEKKDRELEAKLSFKAWADNKKGFYDKKAKEEAKKKEKLKKETEEKEVKKYEAKKLFKSWKQNKDEELKDKHHEKIQEEKRKLREEERKKKEKQKDSKSAFNKWNETKEEHNKEKVREAKRQEREKKRKEEEEKKKKEMMSTQAYDEFLQKKEQQEKEDKRRKRTMTPVAAAPFRPCGRTVPFGK